MLENDASSIESLNVHLSICLIDIKNEIAWSVKSIIVLVSIFFVVKLTYVPSILLVSVTFCSISFLIFEFSISIWISTLTFINRLIASPNNFIIPLLSANQNESIVGKNKRISSIGNDYLSWSFFPYWQ